MLQTISLMPLLEFSSQSMKEQDKPTNSQEQIYRIGRFSIFAEAEASMSVATVEP